MALEQENRIDKENRMPLDFHAARALGRNIAGQKGVKEFEGLAPEERRKAIANATFREGDVMRNALLQMLDRIEGMPTPEQQKLLNRLMDQCQKVAEVWTKRFPLEGAPTGEKIIDGAERFLKGLPIEVLQGFVDLCPKSAQLVVLPGKVTAPQQLKAIDANKPLFCHGESEIFTPKFWNNVRVRDWKFGITDGREDLPFDESISWLSEGERQTRTNEQMVAEYKKRFAQKGLTIMPPYGYVPAAATRLANGQVLDRRFYTAFEGQQGSRSLLYAAWVNDHINLDDTDPGSYCPAIRCRPWFEGGEI